MNTSVSVSVRSLLVAMGIVVAVLVGYVLGGPRGGVAPAAAAAAAPTSDKPARSITMTGTGDATGVPDQMSFNLSVGSTADDVATAMDEANKRMSAATKALRKNGVEKKDIETTGLSIDPQYDYVDQREVLTGYRVKQSASVLVRSLRDAGKALGAAVSAGGNSSRVSGLNLQIGDRDDLLAQAREKAVDEATAKAQQYAEATDQDLGDVVTLTEVKATPARPLDDQFRSADMTALAQTKAIVPIQAGSEKVDVEVSVVWTLR